MTPLWHVIGRWCRIFVYAIVSSTLFQSYLFAQSPKLAPSPVPVQELKNLQIEAAVEEAGSTAASNVLNDSLLRFDTMRIRIQFDSDIFDAKNDKQRDEQLATFCRVWQDSLLRDKGPWGFGLASEVTCMIKPTKKGNNVKIAEVYDHWNLFVEKTFLDDKEVIEASLCRFKPSTQNNSEVSENPQKCEARRVFPWSEFRIRFIRHRAFVRLIVASLLDQMPFVSMVTKNLIRFDSLRIEGFPENNTIEVKYPLPPQNLIFVEARYDPFVNRFRLREIPVKEAIYLTISKGGTVWIVTRDGRAARNDEFSRNIESAFIELTTLFRLDKLKLEKDKANLVATSLKSRPYMDLVFRGDGHYGFPMLSLTSSRALTGAVSLRINSSYLAAISSTYTASNYQLGTNVEEKDNSEQAKSAAKVSIKEVDVWMTGKFVKIVSLGKLLDLELSGGPRLGFIACDGEFKVNGGLPQDDLTIGSQEIGLGATLGLGIPIQSMLEVTNFVTVDMGVEAGSSTIRAGSEVAWIFNRLSTPGRKERPPGFRFGGLAYLATLGRRFVNNDAQRTFETLTTLNGVHLSLFVEQAF